MGRAIEKLSALKVEKLAKLPGMHGDGGGLYLRVASQSSCSWVFRFMKTGKAREMGLGPYPAVSLARAREKAAAARSAKADGRDPVAERHEAKIAARVVAARAMTFKQAAEKYIEDHRSSWRSSKHGAQWKATLGKYVYPICGHLPVGAIDVSLVMQCCEPIWSAKPETAGRVRGRLETVLDWATARGYREGVNPARWRGHLENLLPAHSKIRKVKHHAALPWAEIAAFVLKLQTQDGVAAEALQFTILTAARTGEALGARFDEINFHDATWTIPSDRMKAGVEHRVPLSKEALRVLDIRFEKRRADNFIFPGLIKGRPLSNMAMLTTLRRMDRSDLTVHGFRSTFRDWVSEQTNFPREVAEMALAHAIESEVEKAYRRGDLFTKRRRLMDAWANYCTSQPSAVVLPMRISGAE